MKKLTVFAASIVLLVSLGLPAMAVMVTPRDLNQKPTRKPTPVQHLQKQATPVLAKHAVRPQKLKKWFVFHKKPTVAHKMTVKQYLASLKKTNLKKPAPPHS